jgi:lysozyme
MRDSGVLAVILKCTEGLTFTDDSFAGHRDAALAATLAVGSYHFLRPGNAAAQMEFYIATLQPAPGERVVIDYEDPACTLAELEEAVTRIIAIDPSLQIAVYSGHLIKQHLEDGYHELLATKTSLWIAQYTDASVPVPQWPNATWPVWSLWQYTDEAQVPGCPTSGVDGNRFNGSDEQLLAWIGPIGYGPAPVPSDDQPRVGMLITADRPVTVAIEAGENVTIA